MKRLLLQAAAALEATPEGQRRRALSLEGEWGTWVGFIPEGDPATSCTLLPVVPCGWEYETVQPPWEVGWQRLQKWHRTATWSSNAPGTSPEEPKAGAQRDICTHMFLGAPCTAAKMQKQARSPSTDDRDQDNVLSIYPGMLA